MKNKLITLLLEGKTLIENNYELRNQCSLSRHPTVDGLVLFWLRSFRARHGNRPGQVRCRPGSDVIGNDMHRLVRDGGNHYPADNPHV